MGMWPLWKSMALAYVRWVRLREERLRMRAGGGMSHSNIDSTSLNDDAESAGLALFLEQMPAVELDEKSQKLQLCAFMTGFISGVEWAEKNK